MSMCMSGCVAGVGSAVTVLGCWLVTWPEKKVKKMDPIGMIGEVLWPLLLELSSGLKRPSL
jgi:hypothetical protein